jgi:predicted esterase
MEIAQREIRTHYLDIKDNHELAEARNILSGFSKGGHVAIQGAFESWLPVAGFIAVAPYVGDPLYWQPLLEQHKGLKVRGYFLLGQDDEMCTPGTLKLADMLKSAGIACVTRIFPGLGHGFPDDFDRVLPEAIQFILEKM